MLAAAMDETMELHVNATGAAVASDVDVPVIFRSSFDVADPDGTQ